VRRLSALLAGAAAVGAVTALASCAQPSPPPGGPPDPEPPVLVRVSPDSGSVNARPDEVLFRFDEVVAERPSGAPSLDQLVLVSPRAGTPEVRWRRSGIAVRPRGGWRENTTYVVELLPGIADLRGNRRDSSTVTVFSTGAAIAATRIAGVVFDWPRGAAAGGALVEAIVLTGGERPDSVFYVTRADSAGRFTLPYVPPGAVTLRGVLDANRNFALEPREAYDSLRFSLRDSARVELYAFVHDTVGPRIGNVVVQDSVTLRVTLDQPLAVAQPLDTSLVRLFTADSAPLAVARVLSARAADSLRAAAADTARPAAAPADTARRPPADAARRPADTTRAAAPPPAPRRAVPITELVVRPARPLAPNTRYRIVVTARGLLDATATSDRILTTPAPPATPADTAARRPPADTAARRTPPDTAARRPPPDTAPRRPPPGTAARRPR
jgi:hypothetical protein